MNSINESHPKNDSKLRVIECVACKEQIHPNAKICPQCGSPQKPDQWSSLGKILKVVAGFTAILSLIIVATDVNKLASEERNRRAAAMELVDAAQLLWEIRDTNTALSLLRKADVMLPGIREANELRTDIGIATISRINPLDGYGREGLSKLSIEKDDAGIISYYLGTKAYRKDVKLFLKDVIFPESLVLAGNKSIGSERAQFLAYLAWVELIRQQPSEKAVNINNIFNKALEANKNDTTVNLLRAAWLASERYDGPLEYSTRLELSKASFAKVLEYVSKKPDAMVNGLSLHLWLRALQLKVLPAIESLSVVQDMRSKGELFPELSTRGLTGRLFISLSGWSGAPDPKIVKKIETDLVSHFKPVELIEITTWLASIHYGCSSDGKCTVSGHESGQMLFAIGRMYELDGNSTRAYEYYQHAKHVSLAGWWRSTFLEALKRTEPASKHSNDK